MSNSVRWMDSQRVCAAARQVQNTVWYSSPSAANRIGEDMGGQPCDALGV